MVTRGSDAVRSARRRQAVPGPNVRVSKVDDDEARRLLRITAAARGPVVTRRRAGTTRPQEQGSLIRRGIIRWNRHADDTRPRQIVARADMA